VVVKLYVEGAGPTDLQRSQCRQAFQAFFKSAGLAGRLPGTVACGGRQAAYDDFVTAVAANKSCVLPLLLVDSEGPVAPGQTAWQHLRVRDNWTKPAGASDDQAFLMVQVMETWFLADSAALQRYAGPGYRGDRLSAWSSLEDVPKRTVFQALRGATAHCGGRRYAKGTRSFEILGMLNAGTVENACPHAKELLDRLRSL